MAVPCNRRSFTSTSPIQRWEGSKFSSTQTAASGHCVMTIYPSNSLLFPIPCCYCHTATVHQPPTRCPIFKDHSGLALPLYLPRGSPYQNHMWASPSLMPRPHHGQPRGRTAHMPTQGGIGPRGHPQGAAGSIRETSRARWFLSPAVWGPPRLEVCLHFLLRSRLLQVNPGAHGPRAEASGWP